MSPLSAANCFGECVDEQLEQWTFGEGKKSNETRLSEIFFSFSTFQSAKLFNLIKALKK